MEIIKELFKSFKQVFRYLVPAFVFIILLRYFDESYYNRFISALNETEFVLYFILLGLTIYSIHRVVFEVFDYLIQKCKEKKSITNAILNSIKLEKEQKDYFYYKLATIHSALITAELITIFSIVKMNFSGILSGGILFIISFCVYVGYFNVQTKSTEDNAGET